MPEPADRSPSLRDRIAQALYEWAVGHTTGGARFLAGRTDKPLRENSLARADAVLPVVEAALAAIEQRAEKDFRQLAELYAGACKGASERAALAKRAEQAEAARRKAQEAAHERQGVRAYLAAVEQPLNLPDRGKRAIETARHELYSDAQAAQGFPLLAQTAGVMDEHKVTVHAAWLVADGRVS